MGTTPSKVRQQPAPAKMPPQSSTRIPGILMLVFAVALVALAIWAPEAEKTWRQVYDPVGHWWLSTLIAALPVIVLLGTLAILHVQAHNAALLGLLTAVIVAVGVFHMPAKLAAKTTLYGAAYGFLPIGWIILNVIFMYQLTADRGHAIVATVRPSKPSPEQEPRGLLSPVPPGIL